ncbi:hypothetical protein [Arthrobacter sp. H5]|uniref:hypothetical protein n=1 Tax=Arthrobacter sp. H5 TaxID=1267973 RepID=UPI000483017C|nr:hypothetical protein [Arthrobacter sp. H5]
MSPRGQDPDNSNESNGSTDDAVWQDLVSRLEQTPSSASPVAPAPSGEPENGLSQQEKVRAVFENQPRFPAGGPRDYAPADDDDDDHSYHPPEPPALGVGEPLVVLAWLGAIGGPLALLVFAMFWRTAPVMVMLGIVAVFVVSVCFLIFRLPKNRDYDDDGAEV